MGSHGSAIGDSSAESLLVIARGGRGAVLHFNRRQQPLQRRSIRQARYACGEISRAESQQIRADMSGS
jgi:hypothetical protein